MTPQLSLPKRRRFENADAINLHQTDGVLELHYSVKQFADRYFENLKLSNMCRYAG